MHPALLDDSGKEQKDLNKKKEVRIKKSRKEFSTNGSVHVELKNLISNMKYEISIWASSEYGRGPKTKATVSTNPFPPIWEFEKIDNTDEKIKISWTMPKPGVGNAKANSFQITLFDYENKKWNIFDTKNLKVSDLGFDKYLTIEKPKLNPKQTIQMYAFTDGLKVPVPFRLDDNVYMRNQLPPRRLKPNISDHVYRNLSRGFSSLKPDESRCDFVMFEIFQINGLDGSKSDVSFRGYIPKRDELTIQKDENTTCEYQLVYNNETEEKNFTVDLNEISYEFDNLIAASNYKIEIRAITEEYSYSSSSNIERKQHEGAQFIATTLPPRVGKLNITKSRITQHTAHVAWKKPSKTSVNGKIYYSVRYYRRKPTYGTSIEVTTENTDIVLKDLAANATYVVDVRMNTDFTDFALYGEGIYSEEGFIDTLEINETFEDTLLDKLGVNKLREDMDGNEFSVIRRRRWFFP